MSRLLQRASSAVLVITCAALTACAVYPPPGQPVYADPANSYGPAVAPNPATEFGRITRIERLNYATERQSSGLGALAGAVLGSLIGSQVGRGGGSAAAAGLGFIGGAVLGDAVESGGNQGAGHSLVYRITIRTDRNTTRAFDVSSPGDLRPGDRVQVYQGEISRY